MSRITEYEASISVSESKDTDSITVSTQYTGATNTDYFGQYQSKKAILDHNYFSLNGESGTNGWNFVSDTFNTAGFLSNEKSDSIGEFATSQYALVELTSVTSSIGVWFYDLHGRSLERKITIYDQNMSIIKEFTIDVTEERDNFYFVNPVKNFKYVKFEITKTVPYSHAMNILWQNGGTLKFDSTACKSASCIDSRDISLDSLPISTLKVDIVDKDSVFNFGEEENVTDFINRKTKVLSKYTVDDEINYNFDRYIKTSKLKDNVLTLNATGAFGLLDSEEYDNTFLNGQTVSEILDPISDFLSDNFGNTIDYNDNIDTLTIAGGNLVGMSMREALRTVLQSIGAVARLSRNAIYIEYPTRVINHDIKRDTKISSYVEKKEFVSAVKVNYSKWTEETTISEIITETLTKGVHTLTWSEPATNLTITGNGLITESGYYYAVVSMIADGDITISGNKYTEEETSYTETLDTTGLSDVGIMKEYTNKACNYDRAVEMAQYLLNYHQQRLKIKTKYLIDGTEELGDWANIQDSNGTTQYIAGIENMSIDLVGGVICDLETVGCYDKTSEFAYTGTELYTGEDYIV